jgi:tRNA(Ile)-lysidine synthase
VAARRPPAVARVLSRITETVREHDMLHPGDLVLVMVSGGHDSVCLVTALHRLRRLFRVRLAVFHYDHRLRGGSADDARYVRRVADRLGVPSHVRVADSAPPRGGSVEAWARNERLRAAGEVSDGIGADRIADGHTRDDQAETILLALIRGWGLDGMGGIAPTNGRLIRPLLHTTREEVEDFCRAVHLRPRHDPMNDERSLLRNAIRLDVIPAIERATGRRVRDTFARTAGLIRSDADRLWHDASAIADTIVTASGGAFAIDAAALAALPLPMSSRVVRRGFQQAALPWTEEAIEAIVDLARGREGRRRDLLHGLQATRDGAYVRVRGPSPDEIVAGSREPKGERP